MPRQVILSLDQAPIILLSPDPIPEPWWDGTWLEWFREVTANPLTQGKRILLNPINYVSVRKLGRGTLDVCVRVDLMKQGLQGVFYTRQHEIDEEPDRHPWLFGGAPLPDERETRRACQHRHIWTDRRVLPGAIGLSDPTDWKYDPGQRDGGPLNLDRALQTGLQVMTSVTDALRPEAPPIPIPVRRPFWQRLERRD